MLFSVIIWHGIFFFHFSSWWHKLVSFSLYGFCLFIFYPFFGQIICFFCLVTQSTGEEFSVTLPPLATVSQSSLCIFILFSFYYFKLSFVLCTMILRYYNQTHLQIFLFILLRGYMEVIISIKVKNYQGPNEEQYGGHTLTLNLSSIIVKV